MTGEFRSGLAAGVSGYSRDNLGGYGAGAFGGLLAIAQRVGDGHQRQVQELVGPSDGGGQAEEVGGCDHRRRLVGILEVHRVEHTARRAGASKGHTRNEEIRLLSQP